MDAPAQPDPTPLRNSYWVVPGKVLAGEHPGGTTVEATRERLQRLIAAGVECFMDLTEPSELKPYDPELSLSVEYLRKPIRDHAIPAQRGHMVEILDCIQDAVESGRCVYIHCRAGIGRTGTVVGCLLVERGLPGEAALDELNRLWQQSDRSQNWGTVPETDAQVDFVRTWKPQLGLGTGGAAPGVRAAIFPKSLPPLDSSTDDDESDDKFPFAGLLVADKPTDGLPGRGASGARGARGGAPARDAPVGVGVRGPGQPGSGASVRDAPGVGGRGATQPATGRPVGGASRPVDTPARGVRGGDLPASDVRAGGARGGDLPASDPSVWALRTGGSPGSATPVRAAPVSGAPSTGTPGTGAPSRDTPSIATPRTGSPPATSGSTRAARRPLDVAPPAAPVEDPLLDPVVLAAAGTLRDRFLGALLGLAVGDAVAAATQFRRPGTFTAVGDMLGGGPFDLPRGAWSDDTSMALCLADSLLETNAFNARDQMERYRRWQQEGYLTATGQCVGITASTARAIAMAQWRRQAFSGSHDPSQVDPEPLSRVVAPVLFFFASSGQATDQATEAARTTCQAPVVLDACRGLATALHAALSGQPKAVVLEKVATAATGGRGAPAVLTAAAAAFGATANFRDAVLYAANLGGDSDVVTAVCGQLAGAHYGVKAIPNSWHNGLMQKELIIGYADRLLAHAMLGLSG
jgi:ADP-ribosyl-[dinitrogen reductase] hydrolase